MSKISIKDATIRIKPSPTMCAYISGLDVHEMPANLLSVYRLFGGCSADKITACPAGSTAQLAKPTLTADDVDLLNELNTTKSEQKDKEATSPIQFNDILNITTSELSDGNDDGFDGCDGTDDEEVVELPAAAANKSISKSRAKRLKEQRKECQRERVRLTLADLIWLNTLLTTRRRNGSADSDGVYLHQLLAGSKLSLPRNEIQERDPALEARCVRLRLEQDARVYNAMTKNVDSSRRQLPDDTIAYQSKSTVAMRTSKFPNLCIYAPVLLSRRTVKSMNKQMIAVAQFLFSVAAGFAFGFIGVELLIGNLDFGFRLLLGIICALVIALAEIYFLAKQLNEEYDISVAEEKVVLKSPAIANGAPTVAANVTAASSKAHAD